MKIKTNTDKKPKEPKIADILGTAYTEAASDAKKANEAKEEITKRIKGIAKAEGTKEKGSDKTLLEGDSFIVGFQEIPQYTLDEALMKKLLKPALVASLTATKTFINEDLFKQAVEDKRISREDADKIVLKKGETIRVVVTLKK